MIIRPFLLAIPLVFFASFAGAAERTGELSVSDLLLEPQFTLTEPSRGSFQPGNSYIGFEWRRDRLLSAQVKIGSRELIGVPARYGPGLTANEWAAIEAFAQADTDYGRVRMGLIPIPFGLEGGDSEARLRLPRSLLFQKRMVNIRDYGFSYRISNGGYFSDWAVHNGEGGTDLDNEAWLSARWGWQGGEFFRVGFSGIAGRTTWRSTNPGRVNPSGPGVGTGLIDINRTARIRIANFFLDWEYRPFSVEFEASAGDTRQDDEVTKLRHSRFDVEYEAWTKINILGRYDVLDPSSEALGDQVAEATLGFAFRGQYDNSVFYLLGSRITQEGVSQDVHRVMLMWRIRPEVQPLRASL